MLSSDMHLALVRDRADRLLAEAEGHRLARLARADREAKSHRAVMAVRRHLDRLVQGLRKDRRPALPAV